MKISGKVSAIFLTISLLFTGCGVSASSAGIDTSDFKPPSDFSWEGSYMDSKEGLASLTIDKTAFGYNCTITVLDKSVSHIETFEFTAKEDDMGLIYKDGSRVYYDIPDFEKNADASTLNETVYKDGTGTLYYSDGIVYWIDEKDDYGKDLEFVQQSGVISDNADTEEQESDQAD